MLCLTCTRSTVHTKKSTGWPQHPDKGTMVRCLGVLHCTHVLNTWATLLLKQLPLQQFCWWHEDCPSTSAIVLCLHAYDSLVHRQQLLQVHLQGCLFDSVYVFRLCQNPPLSTSTSVMCMLQSRAQFRKLLQGLGLVEEDQDVYHIIASDHGGADHVSNYHFLQVHPHVL